MLSITHVLAGDECRIHVPERRDDLAGFEAFLARGDKVLAVDTETTGLDIYSPDHACRLVQFGARDEAWVLRADAFAGEIRAALRQPRAFVGHNFHGYDALVLDRHLGVRVEETCPQTFDTRILAHLLDPRAQSEGGIGLGLKALSTVYVDAAAPDTTEGLTAVFRSLGLTKATGWAGVPIDEPTYLRYAGLDVLLTARLFGELGPLVRDVGLDHLSRFEHLLAMHLAVLQRRGMLLDVPYVERLKADLLAEQAAQTAAAARYGVANPNSTRQVAEALAAMGEELTETTPSGAVKVDKAVLLGLADLDLGWERLEAREPNPLADAILRAKRAGKWAESYAQAFLDLRDAGDRLHPFIGGLQARTARMSVSRPPLQQLPSSDWRIRRSFVADPGHLLVTADYDQIELRVLAALADVKGMKAAIVDGRDLHDYTASLVYGDGFTKFQRKLMKGVGFGKVYGGGAATLARQTGAPIDAVRAAIAEYDRVYPEVKRYGRKLQARAEFGKREVVTASGRHLPLDRDRLYSAVNYVCQSTARDVLAQAIVDAFEAGLGDHLLLPIHDELLAQAPAGEAEEFARELGRVMTCDFFGVPLTAGAEVVGGNWGQAYGGPA